MDKDSNLASNDDNIESPTTYGKEAYKNYRKKEKLKEKSEMLGDGYGQKRTKVVMNARYATIIAQLLKDMPFPAKKTEIITYILQNRSSSVSRTRATDALSLIQQVQEKKYKTVADLTDTVGLLKDIS